MAKKTTTRVPVDQSLLTDVDREELTKQARASVLETLTQEARDQFFAEQKEKARREKIPEDQHVHVTIDMAPFLRHIMIDGTQYFHGYTYEVPWKRAAVLYEQMQRSWHHQDEIEGRGRSEAYRQHGKNVIGPRHAGQPTRSPSGGTIVAEI